MVMNMQSYGIRCDKERGGEDRMPNSREKFGKGTDTESRCRLCPRECGADRANGQAGICGVSGSGIFGARAALHMWEEPCISGENGSGAVFFSGCPLRCIYCQNYKIARADIGRMISTERLADIFLELQGKKAENINLVTPTHYTPEIISAVKMAKKQGLKIPVVYNCSGYEKTETLNLLEGIVDIYLTDFKYMEPKLAKDFSRAEDYPEIAKAALGEMVRQQECPAFDERGMMKNGVIVRHLLLPGHVKNAKAVVDYVYGRYGDKVYISLMNQYTPLRKIEEYPELNRRVTKREYETLIDYAISLGVECAFIQEGSTAEASFIPEFDYEGL